MYGFDDRSTTSKALKKLHSYIYLKFPIFLGITFISWLSDRVEASRVGKKYYMAMILSAIIPLLVAGFFVWMYGGVMEIF